MPLAQDLCGCTDASLSVDHTIFLGLSVSSFNANTGWSSSVSSLDVVLYEDNCYGPRKYWNQCLDAVNTSGVDPGFVGENRYRDSNNNEYSDCTPRDVSDTLLSNGIEVVGLPAYFRVGDFEFSGIISDWTKEESCGSRYRVRLVDPRIILQGVYLIVGDYAGRVDQVVSIGNGGTGCATPNLFNVYGFMEQFGLYCPELAQCAPCTYTSPLSCPANIDGTVFGAPFNGFGGSGWNQNGLPVNQALIGFNILANSTPSVDNVFSPYGRVTFCKQEPPLNGYGLIQPDQSVPACADQYNGYYIDLSELPISPANYRINSSVISVTELLDQLAGDFGFDYYVELVPVKDILPQPCVYKFIKVRVVYRTNQPNTNAICNFVSNSECVAVKKTGRELRSEASSKFIIGSEKYNLFQACQSDNPDQFLSAPPNDDASLASLNSCTNTLTVVTDSGCPEIDDTILPYFGTYPNGDLIKVCKDVDGYWSFYPPTADINQTLSKVRFTAAIIEINERELQAALMNLNSWHAYIEAADTDTYQPISSSESSLAFRGLENVREAIFGAENLVEPRDIANPHVDKDADPIQQDNRRIRDDIQEIYDWVVKYARDFYGKRFAVRVPYACCYRDLENNKLIISDEPTNDGGWTEVSHVIGLPNHPLSLGIFEYLNFFRVEDGRIQPFVRIDNAVGKDVSHLNKDDYLFFYDVSQIDSLPNGAGPPINPPATTSSNRLYLDVENDRLYIYYWVDNTWYPVEEIPVKTVTSISGCIKAESGICEDVPLLNDVSTNTVYLSSVHPTCSTDGEDVCYNFFDFDEQLSISLYVRARVYEEYKFFDAGCCYAPRVVMEIPQAITDIENLEAMKYRGLRHVYNALSLRLTFPDNFDEMVNNIANSPGDADAYIQAHPRAELIGAAAIPLKSKNFSYGPWTNPSAGGGTINVVKDPSIAPWNFGSIVNMNIAGRFLADSARTDMKVGEVGEISIIGYPRLPLGAEIGASPGGDFLIENRSVTTLGYSGYSYEGLDTTGVGNNPNGVLTSWNYLNFQYTAGSWTGSTGPNITSVTVNAGCPATTIYTMKTFSPRTLGLDKYLVDQLQKFNAQSNRQVEYLRSVLERDKAERIRRGFFG